MSRAILLVSLAVLVLFLVVLPSLSVSGSLADKLTNRRKEQESLEEKVRVLGSLDLQLLNQRLEVLDRALPPRKDVVLYLSTVDGLSRELELSFTGLSLAPGDVTEASESAKAESGKPRRTELAKGVQTLETEIKVNGRQERIYEFLRTIENSAPLMQVKDVKVAPIGSEGDYALTLRLGMLWAAKDVGEIRGAVTLFTDKEEKYFAQLTTLRSFQVLENLAALAQGLGKEDLFAVSGAIPQP